MAVKRHVVDLGTLGEVTFLIDYTYSKGWAGTRDDPPEGAEMIINSVRTESGTSIQDMLHSKLEDDDDLWQEIHELETVDAAADAADYYNDLKRDEAYEEDLRKTGAWE